MNLWLSSVVAKVNVLLVFRVMKRLLEFKLIGPDW